DHAGIHVGARVVAVGLGTGGAGGRPGVAVAVLVAVEARDGIADVPEAVGVEVLLVRGGRAGAVVAAVGDAVALGGRAVPGRVGAAVAARDRVAVAILRTHAALLVHRGAVGVVAAVDGGAREPERHDVGAARVRRQDAEKRIGRREVRRLREAAARAGVEVVTG